MRRPWPTINSIDCRDEEELAGAWAATGDAKRTASRTAPAFSFHAALTYDFTRPAPSTALGGAKSNTGLIATKRTKPMSAFYGRLAQSQMSNRQRGGENPFLVLFGHSHSQSQSHSRRRFASYRHTSHKGFSEGPNCFAAAHCFAPARRHPAGLYPAPAPSFSRSADSPMPFSAWLPLVSEPRGCTLN